jgi:phosphatidylglycerol:prolipoprotein diacylglycerol transferase
MANVTDYWTHDLSPFLIRFPDNPLHLDGIRYYGLSYLCGFLGAWLLFKLYHKRGRLELNADAQATLMTAAIIGVLAGGRIGYMLFYDLGNFLSNPLLVFRVNQGGMASHGGFLGVCLVVIWFSYKYKMPFLKLGDIICTVAPLGIFFGRIANFINGELWGRVTTVSWAVIFPDSPKIYQAASGIYGPEPRHPSQMYASLLEGALLLAYVQWRFWKTRPPAGQLGGEFLIGYGIVRIFTELFREPDATLIFGLTRGQFYSTFMILAGAAIIAFARRNLPSSQVNT